MVPPTEQQVVAQAKKDVGWDIGSGGGGMVLVEAILEAQMLCFSRRNSSR
jgi:hypothetical protein